MLNIKQYRDKSKGLPDLLNIAILLGSFQTNAGEAALALQKDGSFLAGVSFEGPDLESLGTRDIEALSGAWNNALSRIGTGWGVHVTAIREPSGGYIPGEDNRFPSAIPALVDAERRAQHGGEDHHFVSRYYMTLTWQTPEDAESGLGEAMIIRGTAASAETGESEALRDTFNKYQGAFETVIGILKSWYRIRALDADALLTHIHECLSGNNHKINAPRIPAYLDAVLGHHDFIGGLEPAMDGVPFRIVTAIGFPVMTFPEILESLHSMPFPMRYTVRFLPLDQVDATKLMGKIRDKWFGSRSSLKSMVAEKVSGEAQGNLSADDTVVNLAYDAKQAIHEANEGALRYGFFSLGVVLRSEHRKVLDERVKTIKDFFDNSGFNAYLETTNTVEAFLGSIPGHLWENVRRPLIHSLNFADFAPKTAIWAGEERCPSPLMKMSDGRKAPPLMMATTTGNTPMRVNLHVGDLGHSLVLGPTGAGKSTFLALLALQWMRYEGARMISFDKGMSMYAATMASHGQHYDILGEHTDLSFAPLQHIERPEDNRFACEWLEGCAVLQGMKITTEERSVIRDAVASLTRETGRSLTDLVQLTQDQRLKNAFKFYTLEGNAGKLLDAEKDGLDLSAKFITFELDHLLQGSEQAKLITVPTLLYLFHRIEQMLDGRPTMILLDEAWVMMDNPMFLAKIREWLKVLRKKNAVVVFATQSLMDMKDSPLLPVLQESCPTKIFLPNREATSQLLQPMYHSMGLNARQIELLAASTPKRDYYLFTPDGQRRIQLQMGPVTLAFTGVSDPREVKRIRELCNLHGHRWPIAWLQERLPYNAQDWISVAEELFRHFEEEPQ